MRRGRRTHKSKSSLLKFNCSDIRVLMQNKRGMSPLTDEQLEFVAQIDWKLFRNQDVCKTHMNKYNLLKSKQEVFQNDKTACLSETAKSIVRAKYSEIEYGVSEYVFPKHTTPMPATHHGVISQSIAMNMINKVTGSKYKPYHSTIENSYLKGIIDAYEGGSISTAKSVAEIKCATSYSGLIEAIDATQKEQAYWQAMGYMALTDVPRVNVYVCLVSFDKKIVDYEVEKYVEKSLLAGKSESEIIHKANEIRKSLNFEHIPESKRIIKQTIERDSVVIEDIYERIELCRDYYNHISESIAKSFSQNKRK